MKGLLLKDFYMTMKYCRAFLIISALLVGVSFVESNSLFLVFYPCMLAGMIPVTILGYDERSGWLEYSETMPYSRAQIVSGKYVLGLLAQAFMLVLTAIAQAVRMSTSGAFVLEEYVTLMILLITMSLLASSISLPFMFKLGTEKGRMAYYIMVGLVCTGSIVMSNAMSGEMAADIKLDAALSIVCLIAVGIYAFSWYMSIVFYKKREL